MSMASCLLLYSIGVAMLGPRLLIRFTRAGVAPRLGVLAWLTAMGTVVGAGAAAAGFLVANMVRSWNEPGRAVISACLTALGAAARGGGSLLVQVGLLVLAMATGVALAVLAWRLGRSLVRARARTHEHAQMARITGRRVDGLDAVVLDAPERAAYCVAGRPHTIVITSGALQALDQRHLGAVLAHEQAHLSGRHHLLLALTRALATLLPRVDLFRTGAGEVAVLLEMCADDAAARCHGSPSVLGALLALSGAPVAGSAPVPASALGATGVGVLARAQRLAAPARPADRARARLVLTALVALIVGGPLLMGLLTGLTLCGPMNG